MAIEKLDIEKLWFYLFVDLEHMDPIVMKSEDKLSITENKGQFMYIAETLADSYDKSVNWFFLHGFLTDEDYMIATPSEIKMIHQQFNIQI